MKIVLFHSVDNLGRAGETVDVRAGYFRNFLQPRGFAAEATPGNLKTLESRRKKIEEMVVREKSDAESFRDRIAGTEVAFTLRANERGQLFGSVTGQDISDALRAKGFEIDRRKIELDHVKTLGTFKARIRVYPEVFAEIAVKVEREIRPGEDDGDMPAVPARRSRKSADDGSDAPAEAAAEATETMAAAEGAEA